MSKTIKSIGLSVLKALAEYRVLSITQLAVILFSSKQMARRSVRQLISSGLISITRQPMSGTRGRPEDVVFLTAGGVRVLKKSCELDVPSKPDSLADIDLRTLNHQLLTNWVRLHLDSLNQQKPALEVMYLNPVRDSDQCVITIPGSRLVSSIVPDGVFVIRETSQSKAILFFLEVDMATETLLSSGPFVRDIGKKVDAYKLVFRDSSYKKFERVFGAKFRGFRVLFVTKSETRLKQLCQLVFSTPNTDFIWLTESDAMFKRGVSGAIWKKGGSFEDNSLSILGPTVGFDCPLPLRK